VNTPIYDQLSAETGVDVAALAEARLMNQPLPEEVLYPDITVQLTGTKADAGAIMARVCDALTRYLRDGIDGLPAREWGPIVHRFRMEAMSGSYDDLLRTCMRWVNVE
jgi:hypothetical protein